MKRRLREQRERESKHVCWLARKRARRDLKGGVGGIRERKERKESIKRGLCVQKRGKKIHHPGFP